MTPNFPNIFFSLFLFTIGSHLSAQVSVTPVGQELDRRIVTSAMPFLTIAPDARSAGIGDVGAATSADINSSYWNAGKLCFIDDDLGIGLSHTPWLSKIVSDMSLSYLTGYYKINKQQTVSVNLNFFNLGSITFTDNIGAVIQTYNPNEFSFGATYSRMLSESLGIGISLKYLRSDLAGDFMGGYSQGLHPARGLAGDLGIFWNTDFGKMDLNKIALGGSLSNIGNKVTYSNDNARTFIPANFRIGTTYTRLLNLNHHLSFSVDFNKLMVPTPNRKGQVPNISMLKSLYTSFYDAPDGFEEEMKEVVIGGGVEYNYDDTFFLRTGYFWEDYSKGNRKYFTFGTGFGYSTFGVDFVYLVPVMQEHPLAETMRFSLLFNLEKSGETRSITDEPIS